MSLRVYLRTTVSVDAMLLAMPRLTLPDFHGAMARSYGGLRLKHLDGKR